MCFVEPHALAIKRQSSQAERERNESTKKRLQQTFAQSHGSQVKEREKQVTSRPRGAFNKLLRNQTAFKLHGESETRHGSTKKRLHSTNFCAITRQGNKSRVDQDALSTKFCAITRQSSQAIAPDVAVPRQQKGRRRPLHRRSPS